MAQKKKTTKQALKKKTGRASKMAKAAKRVTAAAGSVRKRARKKETRAKRAPVAKSAAAKASARKTARRKIVARKVTARRIVARKTAARKTTARKTATRKAVTRKTAAKIARKAPKKARVRKPVRRTTQVRAKLRIMKKQVPAKTVVIAKAPAKRTERPEADQQIRAAYGTYGGVVICENPKPFPKRSPYTPKEMKTLRELLLEERTRLREVLRSLDEMTLRHPDDEADSAVPGYSFHLAENATDNVDTETALLLRRDEEAALVQVEAAVERLEHGLFGVCMACSSKIGMDRLKAKPEAHLCMTCQKVYDEKVTSR